MTAIGKKLKMIHWSSLAPEDQRYLAENFLAFFNRDYRAVADAHLRAGWVPPHTRAEEFEAAIRTVASRGSRR